MAGYIGSTLPAKHHWSSTLDLPSATTTTTFSPSTERCSPSVITARMMEMHRSSTPYRSREARRAELRLKDLPTRTVGHLMANICSIPVAEMVSSTSTRFQPRAAKRRTLPTQKDSMMDLNSHLTADTSTSTQRAQERCKSGE